MRWNLGAHFIALSPGTKTIFTPLHHIVRQYHSVFTQCLHFTTRCTTAFTTGCRQQVAVYTDLYKNRTIVGKNDKMIRLQIDAVMLRVGGLGDGGGGNRLAAAQCTTGWVTIQLFLIYMQNCSSLLYIVWFGDHPGQHAPKLQDMCTRDIRSNFFCNNY